MSKFDKDQGMKEMKGYPTSPCILSVSPALLKEYRDAYVPQIVSIGPCHFGKEWLRGMETFKGDAARREVVRIQNATGNSEFKFEQVIDKIRSREEEIKRWYDKGRAFEGEVLLWMVARDACFILEFFRNHLCKLQDDESFKDDFCFLPKLHPIFGPESGDPRVKSEIMKDLIKLDNQIPLFVLEDVLAMEMPDNAEAELEKLLRTVFEKIYYRPFEFCAKGKSQRQSHILDIYHYSCLGAMAPENGDEVKLTVYCSSFAGSDGGHCSCLSAVGVRSENGKFSKQSKEFPSAVQLKNGGVKFKANGTTVDDVTFEGRTLTLVPLKLDVDAELYIRNLIALEICSSDYKHKKMTAYAKFMYELCQTDKGVDVMIEEGVIIGNLCQASEVFRVFSSCKRLPLLPSHDPFEQARTQLIKYYNGKFLTAAAKIWNEFWNAYGYKPWLFAGGFGATIVVVCLFKHCGA